MAKRKGPTPRRREARPTDELSRAQLWDLLVERDRLLGEANIELARLRAALEAKGR